MAMDWGLVLGVIGVIGIPVAIGLTMAATTPGEFRFVRGCFIVATALTITSFVWLTREYPLGWIKIASAGAVGAIIIISLVVALEWVTRKQAAIEASQSRQKNGSDSIKSELTQPQRHARFQIIKIDIPAPMPKLSATAHITVINKGDIAATNLVYSWSAITSDHILTEDEEDNGYLTALQSLPSLDKGGAIEYSHDEGLIIPIDLINLTNVKYNSVIAGKLRFYLLIVFSYKDRNTPKDNKIITEDCNQFFSSFERRSCRGHTRTYLSELN